MTLQMLFLFTMIKLKQHVQVIFMHLFQYQTKLFLHPPHDSFDQKINYCTRCTQKSRFHLPKQNHHPKTGEPTTSPQDSPAIGFIAGKNIARSAPHLPPRPGRDFRDGRDALDEEKARCNGEICEGGSPKKKVHHLKIVWKIRGFFLKHLFKYLNILRAVRWMIVILFWQKLPTVCFFFSLRRKCAKKVRLMLDPPVS